jgi:hypothetical protein
MNPAKARARVLARKKGIPTYRLKPKNTDKRIIYKNPLAEISRSKKYLGTENIEWVTVREPVRDNWNHEPLSGSHGAIYTGRVKFKGVPKPKPVAIKAFKGGRSPEFIQHLKEVVQRLSQSKASHPKMAVLEAEYQGQKYPYLLMVPYLSGLHGFRSISRFEQSERIVNTIRIRNPSHQEILKQIVTETAELAKVGLGVNQTLGVAQDFIALGIPHEVLVQMAHKQIDSFNRIKFSNGESKIYSQDVDEMRVFNHAGAAWKYSLKNIYEVVLENNPGEEKLIKRIIKEAAKKYGLRLPFGL